MQGAAGGNPRRNAVVVGREQQQVRGGSDFFAVGLVLRVRLQREPDNRFGHPRGQVGRAHHRVTQAVQGALAVRLVKANPREQFALEGVVAQLGAVARHDQFGELRKRRSIFVPDAQMHAVACRAGEDVIELRLRDGAAVVQRAVGLPQRNLREQRIQLRAGLFVKADGNRACRADCGRGRIAVMVGGNAQVFRGAAQADKEFAVVGIHYRQAFAEIGRNRDGIRAKGKKPRLGVMPGRGFARIFDHRVEIILQRHVFLRLG